MRDDDLLSLLARRLPPELAAAPPELRRYPDELVLILQLAPPADGEAPQALLARRREESRALRVELARELERAAGLPVAWGMRAGGAEALFTTRTAPVMTRLGRAEREVLDTLVAAGVADTRSSPGLRRARLRRRARRLARRGAHRDRRGGARARPPRPAPAPRPAARRRGGLTG
jgi:hypothetical protein